MLAVGAPVARRQTAGTGGPRFWLSPTATRMGTLATQSQRPGSGGGRQQGQSCLCVFVSGHWCVPSVNQRVAGGLPSGASFQASMSLPRGRGQYSGRGVAVLLPAGANGPSTTALQVGRRATVFVVWGGGSRCVRGLGGGCPTKGEGLVLWWCPPSAVAAARVCLLPTCVVPYPVWCRRPCGGLAARQGVCGIYKHTLER